MVTVVLTQLIFMNDFNKKQNKTEKVIIITLNNQKMLFRAGD